MDWARTIGRTPDLAVDDRHYTWAGQAQLSTDADGWVRVVDVTLDAPAALSWNATAQIPAGAKLQPQNAARVRISGGVSRSSFVYEGDLLGAYSGQIQAQTLRVEVAAQPDAYVGLLAPQAFVVNVNVGNDAAGRVETPTFARLVTLHGNGVDPVLLARRSAWRRGVTITPDPRNPVNDDSQLYGYLVDALPAPSTRDSQCVIYPRQGPITLAAYCGPFSVECGKDSRIAVLEW